MYKIIISLLIASLILLALPSYTGSYTAPVKPNIKTYSIEKIREVFGNEQWVYFDDLIDRESKWDPFAQNKYSTAFGYGQFLSSTWKIVGCVKTDDPYKQIDCTIAYIKLRHQNPHKAIHFHDKYNFY